MSANCSSNREGAFENLRFSGTDPFFRGSPGLTPTFGTDPYFEEAGLAYGEFTKSITLPHRVVAEISRFVQHEIGRGLLRFSTSSFRDFEREIRARWTERILHITVDPDGTVQVATIVEVRSVLINWFMVQVRAGAPL